MGREKEEAEATPPSGSSLHEDAVAEPPPPHESDPDAEASPYNAHLGLERTVSLQKDVSLLREIVVVGLISAAQITTQAGLGQTLAILHIIGNHYGTDSSLSWLIAGYSLTVGSFIIFSGRLGDLFGWKRLMVIGYLWYGLWSIVAGAAWYSNDVLFIFARVLSGIGPAITMPNGLALLGGLYEPGPRKNMAFAVFGACAPGGAMIGSAFAGLFALTWWPWTYFSFGIALFGLGIAVALIVPDPQAIKPGVLGKSFRDALHALDLVGAALGITGLILFNFAWNQAPISGWSSPAVIVTLILGIIIIPLFIWYELQIAKYPLLPWDVFTSDNAFMLACVACGWANFGIWIYYLWSILEVLRGSSPLLATAYLSPLAISGACAAITTGLILGRVRPAVVMIIAMCAFLTGTLLIATVPVFQIYWGQFFVCSCIAAFGMDMSFPSATLVISNSMKKEHQGVAASLVSTVVNYSISLGVGISGTVEVHVNNGGTSFDDLLRGYRGALYLGVGLAGLGLFLAVTFLLKGLWTDRQQQKAGEKDAASQVDA